MKAKVLAIVLAAAFAAPAAHAQVQKSRAYSQQNPPHDSWCRDAGDGGGTWVICSAYTFEQCMASRFSHVETCYLNPRYDARFQGR